MNPSSRSVFKSSCIVAIWLIAGAIHAAKLARVACVGDSITFGAGVRDRQANTYPEWLARWMGTEYDVRNFGVSGATLLREANMPYIKQRAYPEALDFKPDIVVIDLGANDSKHPNDGSLDAANAVNNWQYSTNFVAEYEEMIAAFRKANPAAKIYVCFPTPDYPGRWGINDRTIRQEMIPMIRTVSKDTGATVIDLYTAMSGMRKLFPDTVHPNDEGSKVMAAAVYRGLTGKEPAEIPSPATLLLMNRRVLWLGDSITQDGKYVSFVEYYLEKKFPGANFDFISIGLASVTVSGLSEKTHPFPRPWLFERLGRALDLARPATIIACYGMNDGIYHPADEERMRAFQEGIQHLSDTAQNYEAQFILLTPPPFDPLAAKNVLPETSPDFSFRKPFTNYDSVLDGYSGWETHLPPKIARVVVDLHSALDGYLAGRRKQNPKFTFSKDGIHPSPLGHLLMAHTILRSIGVEVGGGDLEAELKKIEADPLFEAINKQREERSAGWLDCVGYTRGKTVKSPSVAETEKTVAAMQAQIDQLRRSSRELPER